MSKPVVRQVCPGVTLSTVRCDDPLKLDYFLEVAKLKVVTVTLDFSGSENMATDAGTAEEPLKVTAELQPYERKKLCTLSRVDKAKGCSWKYSFSLAFASPDDSVIREYVQKDEEKIQSMLELASSLDFGADSASAAELISRCRSNGIHYVDTDFPPTRPTLVPDEAKDSSDVSHITWRRPSQFFSAEDSAAGSGEGGGALPFGVFVGKIEPNDIRQGALADCWFLCALSALAERPEYVKSIFLADGTVNPTPKHSGAGAGAGAGGKVDLSTDIEVAANPEGVYFMRFCKNGKWTTVRVDDYFPCVPCGGPVYSKGHSTELWVMLLEKAYAKMHGSYHSLRLGYTHEALLDITGAPVKVLRLDSSAEAEAIASGKLWASLEHFDAIGCLMTCDTPGSDVWTESGGEPAGGPGLVKGHAYALLRVAVLSNGAQIMQIRNPWSRFEWNGDWSDKSPLWTPALAAEVGFEASDSDGTFWMSWEDFLKYFVRIVICRLSTSAGNPWSEQRFKGSFTRQRTSYGVSAISASLFHLTVPRDGEVALTLHQNDSRTRGGQPYIDVGLTLMQVDEAGRAKMVACTGMEVDRECTLFAEVAAGEYIVVPRTTGCKLDIADMTGTKEKTTLYIPLKKEFSPECIIALEEVFERFDADLDGVLARPEMNKFQRLTDGCDMGDEEYRFLCQYFDNTNGQLTKDGFVAAYKYIFDSRGCDVEQLRKELHSLGYNDQLELVDSRSWVLSLHSDCTPAASLEEVPFDAELFEDAMEMPIIEHGQSAEYADGLIVVHTQQSSHGGLSFAITNNSTFRGIFTMDMSQGGVNVMSHQGNMVVEIQVEPKETEIVHHLMAIDTTPTVMSTTKFPGYSLSWQWEKV